MEKRGRFFHAGTTTHISILNAHALETHALHIDRCPQTCLSRDLVVFGSEARTPPPKLSDSQEATQSPLNYHVFIEKNQYPEK